MKLSHKEMSVELHMRNTVPPPPHGPYFKNMEILSSLKEQIPDYRTSTLEKNYIWQPHVGVDLGIQMCFVDHDSIVDKDKDKIPPLDPRDKAIIEADIKSKRTKAKDVDPMSQPWYFRQTTYISNNPFNMKNKVTEDVVAKTLKEKEKHVNKVNIFSSEFINDSFEIVEKTVEELQKQEKKRKMVSCTPLLPESCEGPISRAFIRFDEDPSNFKVFNDENSNKRYKIDYSLISNTRAPAGAGSSKVIHCTMVAPVTEGESSATATAEEGSNHYKWVRDYSMEIQDTLLADCFIFAVDESAQTSTYFATETRVDMKKIKFSDAEAQEIIVHRSGVDSIITNDSQNS